MHKFTKPFVEYCRHNLDFQKRQEYHYQSLSVCVIDCVYSLRTNYEKVTCKIVERYAVRYMGGDKNRPGDTVSMLLRRMDEIGGPRQFADQIVQNHQKLGGKRQIPKEEACHKLATYLQHLHIDTLEDFQNFSSPELLEIVVRAVKGIGDAGANYLFMLAGDPDRCKPDVHIHHCIQDACGCDLGNDECQILFAEAVQELRGEHPDLTVRILDGIIWRKYQSGRA